MSFRTAVVDLVYDERDDRDQSSRREGMMNSGTDKIYLKSGTPLMAVNVQVPNTAGVNQTVQMFTKFAGATSLLTGFLWNDVEIDAGSTLPYRIVYINNNARIFRDAVDYTGLTTQEITKIEADMTNLSLSYVNRGNR